MIATTIQIVEDISVGRFIDIEGKRFEVEAISISISISQAITVKASQEGLLEVMKTALQERDLIDVQTLLQLLTYSKDKKNLS
ncbi:hypothetical protein ACQKQC_16520 [Vibrio fortis]|uniref:hypothetical protein n=1 Tax=Vibrio fortis TaxID=212667 RepID=UPI0040684396